MKAIVCDKCGKVTLLEDDKPYTYAPIGIYVLLNELAGTRLELCEDCGNELIEAVRREKDGGGDG